MQAKVISFDVKLLSYLPLLVNLIFHQDAELFTIPHYFNILSACINIFISNGIFICVCVLTWVVK